MNSNIKYIILDNNAIIELIGRPDFQSIIEIVNQKDSPIQLLYSWANFYEMLNGILNGNILYKAKNRIKKIKALIKGDGVILHYITYMKIQSGQFDRIEASEEWRI